MAPLRVVHYLNQFFGGVGGEAQADTPVEVREGPVGPGRLLQQALGADGVVVATIVGGDNYLAERTEAAVDAIGAALDGLRPDVVVAGPAFDAGRYGLACAQVCRVAQARGIAALSAMHPENAGLATFRREVLCLPTGRTAAELPAAVARMAALAVKLGRGEPLGSAEEEGYFPRGVRRPVVRAQIGAERAVDILLARLRGEPFRSEIPIASYDRVEPTPPVPDLSRTTVAIVSSGGLVPRGNPDRLVSAFAERFFRYSIADQPGLRLGEWESIHGGYSTRIVNTRNPNFVIPLDAVRDLQAAGAIGGLHPQFYVTVGNGTAVGDAKRMGAQIAEELVAAKVGAALFVAT